MENESNFTSEDAELERRIEALLFASDTPLSAGKLAALTGVTQTRRVTAAIESLRRFYEETKRSFSVVEVAGGHQLTTLPEFSFIVSQMFKGKKRSRLTQPALETVAIIAYKQPISRMQIEAIRGVNCEGVLATLVERELVSISGRGEGIGKPFLYSTTKKFLEYLGLKDFRDLPSLAELERRFALEQAAGTPAAPDAPVEAAAEATPREDGQTTE
jgi:segregation and condensation protein B